MPGTFSPPPRVSDPDMNHGTCVTHVPLCMPGSLTSDFLWYWWRGKRSRHSRRMRNPQFDVSGKRPMVNVWYWESSPFQTEKHTKGLEASQRIIEPPDRQADIQTHAHTQTGRIIYLPTFSQVKIQYSVDQCPGKYVNICVIPQSTRHSHWQWKLSNEPIQGEWKQRVNHTSSHFLDSARNNNNYRFEDRQSEAS